MSIIYIAINKITNKVYIGQTKQTLSDRISKHYCKSKDKSKTYHFMNALRKYSKQDWEWKVLEDNIDNAIIDERETYWIDYYDSFNNGYNSTSGGSTYLRTDEINKKSSESFKKTILKYGHPRLDNNTYTLYNKNTNITFIGTRHQFKKTFGFSDNMNNIFCNKETSKSKSYKGWIIIKN